MARPAAPAFISSDGYAEALTTLLTLRCGLFAILAFFSACALAQNCALSGTSAWSSSLKAILADCETNIVSPNGLLVLNVGPQGVIQIVATTTGKILAVAPSAVEPPAMASWSPNSDGFFINDGEGSGETSVLRLYFFRDGHFTQSDEVNQHLISAYRQHVKCDRDALDPDIWGLRWTQDGKFIDSLVQASIHNPCGEFGSFLGMRVRVSDSKVIEILSQNYAVVRWSPWLPFSLRTPKRQATP